MSPKAAPYGTWSSPITSDAVVGNAIRISSIFTDPLTSSVYHVEVRPSEGGRCVVVDTNEGKDIFGPAWNARSRVQEYGGGAAIAYGGVVYFSDFSDLKVYAVDVEKGGEPIVVTPENKNHRFADFTVSPTHPHLLIAILEDHTHPCPSEVETSLILIDTSTRTVSPVVSGADFYASPRFSPDGKYLVWQQWWHPNMPWQGAEIYVAKVSVSSDGEKIELGEKMLVGGVKGQVSAAYPFWISNETVLFTSDVSGYQNPWSYSTLTGKSVPVLPIPVEKDFSLPGRLLGESYSAILDEKGEKVLYSVMQVGRAVLHVLDVKSGAVTEIESPYVDILSVCSITKTGEVFFIGGQSSVPSEIVSTTLSPTTPSPSPSLKTLKSTSSSITSSFPPGIVSIAQSITIKVPPNGDPVYVNYYPPTNPEYSGGVDGEKPPCVFDAHGGPTGISNQVLSWGKQYFTSRGWAWADVNYGGSYGYGRKYIDRLQGEWGVSEVRDCILAAKHLSSSLNLIDSSRIFIRGGSAGGYTVLVAISNPPSDIPSGFKWTGATSLYGISDLRRLAEDTHKFESQYLNGLMGGSYEEIPEVYKERSPISHVDKIDTPLLILQGTADVVVPPSQAELILDALEERGKKVQYILFEGEGHGWSKAESIKTGLEAELSWYEDLIGVTKETKM
ncbi:alpha/beta-hydrolase [Thelephora ganbajun]|uniref:Alpha/beta-hydrolase n=1 Tax=Thelephora ganbajun TaxID=370292 RepID=A0ACB6Z4Y1_THEGA|nr:alpha/beta-hydrolase [Thelephora ganbajun]